MEIYEESSELFEQDKQYVLDYLKARNFKNRELCRIIRDYPFGLLKDVSFLVGEEEYNITHFLSKSDVDGYDIRKLNTLLKTEGTDTVAFAVVLGDDVLCYDIKNKEVFIWRIQTGDGDKLLVSDDLSKFLKNIG